MDPTSRNEGLRRIALELLEKYRNEKEKQMVVVRLSAKNAQERDKAKMLHAKVRREIEAYEQAIRSAGDVK